MNKRRAKKAAKKYISGRHLTAAERQALSKDFPGLDFSDGWIDRFARAMDQAKEAFEYMAVVAQSCADTLVEFFKQIKPFIPTRYEIDAAFDALFLGYHEWDLRVPLYHGRF